MSRIVVVGGGQAGFSVVSSLISMKYKGQITMVCSENLLPYQRPPLSKKFLLGEIPRERLLFRPESFYLENKIDLRTGLKVLQIDRASLEVEISDQGVLKYEKLILATGARPNIFPEELGGRLKGIYYLRSVHDVELISPVLKPPKNLLIIGGGYIGLEIAAVARKKNLKVTLVEAEDRILKRVACEKTANFFRNLHKKHKVEIIEGVTVQKMLGESGYLSTAILSNGEKLSVDIAIVGIGVTPNVGLAQAAGLEIDNGIKVDCFSQTSDSNILAAGDCTSFPHKKGRLRLESVGNAIDQGENAASNLLGRKKSYIAKPWFWSDQYETKLQIAGLSHNFDEVIERKDEKGLSFWYFSKGKLIAVDAINDGKAYMIGKKLIDRGISPDLSYLLDVKFDLKILLKKT